MKSGARLQHWRRALVDQTINPDGFMSTYEIGMMIAALVTIGTLVVIWLMRAR